MNGLTIFRFTCNSGDNIIFNFPVIIIMDVEQQTVFAEYAVTDLRFFFWPT